MTSHEDVNTPLLAMIGFLGAILVFAIIVLLTVIYYAAEEREDYVKNINQPYTDLDNLLASQRAKLVEYRWVDQNKELVAIPIERAMQLVVAESRSAADAGPSDKGGTDSAETKPSSSTGAEAKSTPRGETRTAPADGGRNP